MKVLIRIENVQTWLKASEWHYKHAHIRTMRQIRLICFKSRANHHSSLPEMETAVTRAATLRVDKRPNFTRQQSRSDWSAWPVQMTQDRQISLICSCWLKSKTSNNRQMTTSTADVDLDHVKQISLICSDTNMKRTCRCSWLLSKEEKRLPA